MRRFMSFWFEGGRVAVQTKQRMRKRSQSGFGIALRPITTKREPEKLPQVIESTIFGILACFRPGPTTAKDWPACVVNRIRKAIPSAYHLDIEGPNNVGVYFYEGDLLILASFRELPAQVTLTWTGERPNTFHLHEDFPHAAGTRTETRKNRFILTVAPWELTVIS